MRVYKARLSEHTNSCVFKKYGDACEHIKKIFGVNLNVGDVVSIEVCEIDEKEFADLPEWDGP